MTHLEGRVRLLSGRVLNDGALHATGANSGRDIGAVAAGDLCTRATSLQEVD
jgi:hypothetical protein